MMIYKKEVEIKIIQQDIKEGLTSRHNWNPIRVKL